MLLDIFAVGTIWFWALIVAEIIILFCCAEFEKGWTATVSFLVFILTLQFLGDVNIFQMLRDHPFKIIALIIPYFLIGAVCSLIFWGRFVSQRLKKHNELFQEFLEQKQLSPDCKSLPIEYRKEWIRLLERNRDENLQTLAEPPRVKYNKSRVVRWISLWLFCVLLYLFKDMTKEICNFIYDSISLMLQRIADQKYAVANVEENTIIEKDK